MKMCRCFWIALVLLVPGIAAAQDPVKVDPSHYSVVLDNPSVRVLKVHYAAGAKSVMHKHPDAIIVPLTSGKMKFTLADGTTQDSDMVPEAANYTPAVTHTPTNAGTGAVDGLLIEFKAAKPGTAVVPTSRPNLTIKTLAEGPHGVAYRTTATPSFHEPAGTKHDFDQVIIALGPSQMSLSLDGKPAKTSWKRGDVQFIGRGVAHESKNAAAKPIDFIIVAIK